MNANNDFGKYNDIEENLRKERRKKPKMKVSGKSVFTLAKQAGKQKKK